jgi:hypothetical protein
MKMIYTHENRMILFNIKNLLQAEGIETRVVNEFAGGAVGDLPAFETWPQLWLDDDSRLPAAEEILGKIFDHRDRRDWYCRGCQELNDASFQLCWKCGRAAD